MLLVTTLFPLLFSLTLAWLSVINAISLPSAALSPLGVIRTQSLHAGQPRYMTLRRSEYKIYDVGNPRVIAKRTTNPYLRFKLIQRHQQLAIIPGLLGASVLKAFWQTISLKALYNSAASESQETLFTVTEGLLQATFSCLGASLPWKTVYDIAMLVGDNVSRGLLETFDVIYEQDITGISVWVSLRILDRADGSRKRERPLDG